MAPPTLTPTPTPTLTPPRILDISHIIVELPSQCSNITF